MLLNIGGAWVRKGTRLATILSLSFYLLFVVVTIIVHHMAKDTGNPSIKVRLTPDMIEALDRIVEVGDYKDRSDVIREWSLVLIEAVLVANSTKKAWKGAWEILKGLNRVVYFIPKSAM